MPNTVSRPIYMDNHATTPVDPRVVEAMLPYFTAEFGNAGSVGHSFGTQARLAVDRARELIAAAIGAAPSEIVFTSGATESNNLAICGVVQRTRRRGDHVVSVATEHRAVLEPLERCGRKGYRVTLLEVSPAGNDDAGRLDPQRVSAAIGDDTCLVSVMLANNEIGVIQPLAEIGNICKSRGVLLHCDATQAVGKIPVNVHDLQVDLMSFSAHKIYGPKGIGALYVRRRQPVVRLEAQIVGGGQQAGRRAGTLNVPGIVGMASALELCQAEMSEEMRRLASMRDRLASTLITRLDGVALCGPALESGDPAGQIPLRLPGNLNLTFGNVDGEALVLSMENLAVSSGAACTAANPEPSHVLRALGLSEDAVRSSLRFGLGRFNSEEDVTVAIETITRSVRHLRELADS